jgi:hypothetical protein
LDGFPFEAFMPQLIISLTSSNSNEIIFLSLQLINKFIKFDLSLSEIIYSNSFSQFIINLLTISSDENIIFHSLQILISIYHCSSDPIFSLSLLFQNFAKLSHINQQLLLSVVANELNEFIIEKI